MKITLGERTAETVKIYFEQAQQPVIRATLPQKAKTVEEALADYSRSILPNATSFGRIIEADGTYVGDIWCYGMNAGEEPDCMMSFCIFNPSYWGRGIASEAVALFLNEIQELFEIRSVGAFVFADNYASIRVLEKNDFRPVEYFDEDNRASVYYLRLS